MNAPSAMRQVLFVSPSHPANDFPSTRETVAPSALAANEHAISKVVRMARHLEVMAGILGGRAEVCPAIRRVDATVRSRAGFILQNWSADNFFSLVREIVFS